MRPEASVRELEALPHQRDLWVDDTPDARLGLVGPLGCGKTYSLAVKAGILALTNFPLPGMLVVPTYDMARVIHIAEWPAIIESVLGVRCVHRPSDGAFVVASKAKIWIRTAEKPARLAGPNLAWVVYDEPGQMAREAWDRGSVRARHPKAKLRQVVAAGTPEGLNWFADLFSAPKPPFRTIRASTWHPDLAWYPDEIRRTYGYDASLVAAYLRGEFVPLRTGRAYGAFVRLRHVRSVVEVAPPPVPLVLACDFNVDAMRWLLVQFPPGEIRVIDEIAAGLGATTAEVAAEAAARIREIAEPNHPIEITGDAAGAARSTAGETDYQTLREILEEEFPGRRIRLNVPRANPRVRERVALVNYHLGGRAGRTVRISERCRELALDLERVAWRKAGADLEKSDPARTHASDALGYAIMRYAPPETRARAVSASAEERARYRRALGEF